MLELHTRHLTLLCVGQFIGRFDYDDLVDGRYRGEYDTTLCGTPLTLYCDARFDAEEKWVTDFDFEVESGDHTPLRIVGSMREAREKARQWINAYLKNYRTYCPLKRCDDDAA